MTTALSICIPTLNRPDYFCKALNSILSARIDKSLIEICVSNNASDVNYDHVLNIIESAPREVSINYIKQKQRLSIDEHMMFVKNMATSPYIYFLGDDDFFLEDQLPLLLELIKKESPDLAIFNGVFVDKHDHAFGSHFQLPPKVYLNIEDAFHDLRDKGMFGSVLVKSIHLNDINFKRLIGTAHAYGCYWFSLLSRDAKGDGPLIMVPDFPLVALRMADKNYDHLEVYLRDIPFELAIYQRYLELGKPQELHKQFKKRYYERISSIKFLTSIINFGCDPGRIKYLSPGFYKRNRLNIHLSGLIVRFKLYGIARMVYRLYLLGLRKLQSFK